MEIIDLSTSQPSSASLRALSTVTLNAWTDRIMRSALKVNGGDAAWQGRKQAEAQDVLALSQIAPPGRLRIDWIDMTDELRVLLFLRVPVAGRPDQNNQLVVDDHVVLGLTYRRDALHRSLPGTAFIDVLRPRDVWHANVGPVPPIPAEIRQVLCLGPTLPAGVRCADLIISAYGALSMQTLQIDERDSAGVLNVEAARWWQHNQHRIPLSSTPFLIADKDGQAAGDMHIDLIEK